MKRRFWIALGVVVLFAVALYFVTREPQPFPFLRKYPIVQSATVADHRFIVLKGDYDDVERELKKLAGRPILEMETGEIDQRLAFFSSGDESFSLGDNVAPPNVEGSKGFLIYQSKTEVRKGFCSILYTPKPSFFGRSLAWIKGFFGEDKDQEGVTWEEVVAGKRRLPAKP